MYGVSDRFRKALAARHTVVSRCTVMRGGNPVLPTLPIVEGNLTIDSGAALRTSGNVTALDTSGQLTPDLVKRMIDVYTCELFIERGVQYPDGTEEVLPIAVLNMSRLSVGRKGGGVTFTANVLDRAARCQGDLPRPWPIPGGTLIEDAIPPLLASRLPILTFTMGRTGYALATQLLDTKKDAWGEATKYAASAGCQLFAGRTGGMVMAPIPTTGGQVAWTFDHDSTGDFRHRMFEQQRDFDPEDAPNVVVVIGTNPAAPGIRAEAWDDNRASTTYRYGPYGQRIVTFEEPRLATQEQAQAMANAKLQEVLGPGDTIEFDAIPNPAMDPYDTLRCTDVELGVEGSFYTLSRLDMPFRAADGLAHVTARRSVLLADDPAASSPHVVFGEAPPEPEPTPTPDLAPVELTLTVS